MKSIGAVLSLDVNSRRSMLSSSKLTSSRRCCRRSRNGTKSTSHPFAEDGAVSARKRRRAEVGEVGGDVPVDDESNSPEHDNDDGKISEDVIAPDASADANDDVALS